VNQDASTEVRANTSAFATWRWLALAAVVVATVAGAFVYWRHAVLYPSTENAYTGSNIVRVASEVSGPVIHVYVHTDESVKAGDPLFDIDPILYDAALRNARAQFDAAADAAGTAGENLKKAADTLEQKRAALEDALKTYRDAKDAQAPEAPPVGRVAWRLSDMTDLCQEIPKIAGCEVRMTPAEFASHRAGVRALH